MLKPQLVLVPETAVGQRRAAAGAALAFAFALIPLGGTGCGTSPPPAKPAPASAPEPAKITMFYPARNPIAPGEEVVLCYGVENAKSVAIEPAVEKLTPSLSRCISVRPAQTTTYTLTATGQGEPVRQSIELRVDRRAPREARTQPDAASGGLIEMFTASQTSVSPGQAVTVCYAARPGSTLRIRPAVPAFPGGARGCFSLRISETVAFTLAASAADGARDSATLKIAVR